MRRNLFFWGYFLGIQLLLLMALEGANTPIPDANPIHEAFVSKFTEVTSPFIVSRPPPPLLEEKVPVRPEPDLIWIPGYWAWVDYKNDFSWVCGVWRRPPPSQIWIPGSWNEYQGGFVWSAGFWSPLPLEKLISISEPPPASIEDKVPPAPGKDYFWVPGYWEYSSNSQSYSWLSGNWQPFSKDWILAPAAYHWRPTGYFFSPLLWDWPLEVRGNAYSCGEQLEEPFIPIEPPVIIQQLYCYYPDYIPIYCHFWHFNPEWWEGCSCIPPWWFWDSWWTFSWHDMWGLWWWWSHPGFLPPFWLSLQLSLEIAPPSPLILDIFKNIKKPPFQQKFGDKPLLPQGKPGKKDVPKPNIPHGITPRGTLTSPPHPPSSLPSHPRPSYPRPSHPRETTPPIHEALPPPRPHAPFPQQEHPVEPTYPEREKWPPKTHYPPETHYPPDGIPPPRGTRWPKWPPRQPEQPQQPSGNQPEVTPPSGNYPGYPSGRQPYFPPSGRHPEIPSTTQPRIPPHVTQPRIPPTANQPNFPPSAVPPDLSPQDRMSMPPSAGKKKG